MESTIITAAELKKYEKRFLVNENLGSYDEFRDSFMLFASDVMEDYQLTPEIEFILKQIYAQIAGYDFYKIDPRTGNAILAKEKDRYKGFFIAGPTGTGKTTFSKIVLDLIGAIGTKYIFDDHIYLLCGRYTSEQSLIREYMKTGDTVFMKNGSLYIDDIGQGREVIYMGNKIDPIREIVTERYDNLKYTFTFFTSNYPIDHQQLVTNYGERVADRIISMCNYYTIKGKNFRRE